MLSGNKALLRVLDERDVSRRRKSTFVGLLGLTDELARYADTSQSQRRYRSLREWRESEKAKGMMGDVNSNTPSRKEGRKEERNKEKKRPWSLVGAPLQSSPAIGPCMHRASASPVEFRRPNVRNSGDAEQSTCGRTDGRTKPG